jgi:hypothetical protein
MKDQPVPTVGGRSRIGAGAGSARRECNRPVDVVRMIGSVARDRRASTMR